MLHPARLAESPARVGAPTGLPLKPQNTPRRGLARALSPTLALACALALATGSARAADPQRDWADVARYRADNASLAAARAGEPRVVFMGDSITEFWSKTTPEAFAGKPWINRGISAQTTPQMLVRFRPDVLALKPAVVVILAGTNDIAGNTGPTTVDIITSNIASMADLARAHGIRVVIVSVLPANRYYWNAALRPAPEIAALNQRLKALAERDGHTWLDLHSALTDTDAGLPKQFSGDGVHPNAAGYAVMSSQVEPAIRRALAAR